MAVNRVAVIAGGDLTDTELDLIRTGTNFIITADAGAMQLEKAGIIPDLAVGDFDTTGISYMDRLRKKGVPVLSLPEEKAVTDMHFALSCAVERKPDEILILGAMGGARFDHTMANVGLLEWLDEQGIKAVIIHRTNRIRLMSGPGKMTFTSIDFKYVSLLPVSKIVSGIRTDGLKYKLAGESLYRGDTRGISNELVKVPAVVNIQEGICLVVESRDRIGE
ncbi:thiamine diphosphokinase [Thermoactinomyces mirandus]|uniref:Thiamine diphosphokinase n=1 Tax=Thermoactinomyces mirandus TaxID=2756294 RepID=A0A7W1XSJ7_9BACL|nr:thiamine diphosphokinase [Thermoactinomyces mirandus]MBA4602401.1 thiamine diphosphokinase [Thermoactinomyces mirandus]